MRPTVSHSNPNRLFSNLALLAALLFACIAPALASDAQRTLLVQTKPVYPEIARQMRIHGVLVLAVTVMPDGHVGAVQIRSGHPILLPAADEAVRKWLYSPAPVTTVLTVEINFQESR